MSNNIGKADGFKDEEYIIIPTESFADYAEHPLVRTVYPTDVGFFPKARDHYRERKEGVEQYILIYCTEGKGTVEVEGQTFSMGKSEDVYKRQGLKNCRDCGSGEYAFSRLARRPVSRWNSARYYRNE